MRQYDSDVLLQYGFLLLPDDQREAADLWLVNTCTVKSPSQSAMDNILSTGRRLGKKLIVAGCVPQGELLQSLVCLQTSHHPFLLLLFCNGFIVLCCSLVQAITMQRRWGASASLVRPQASFSCSAALSKPPSTDNKLRIAMQVSVPHPCVGVSQIDRIVEAVEETLKGNTIHMLAKKALPRLDLPKVHDEIAQRLHVLQNRAAFHCLSRRLSKHQSFEDGTIYADPEEQAHRNYTAVHRLPGSVHVLQDQARAWRAGKLHDGGNCGQSAPGSGGS